jgi:hypothetical protein
LAAVPHRQVVLTIPKRLRVYFLHDRRLRDDADRAEVEWVSDQSEGPYASVHRFPALEFVARLLDHVPGRDETRVRDYGASATRRRVGWRRRGVGVAGASSEEPPEPEDAGPARRARRRRSSRAAAPRARGRDRGVSTLWR